MVEHELDLRLQTCSCGKWRAPIGLSIWREYDKHLLEIRSLTEVDVHDPADLERWLDD